jgi:serine/threonine-protein kinase
MVPDDFDGLGLWTKTRVVTLRNVDAAALLAEVAAGKCARSLACTDTAVPIMAQAPSLEQQLVGQTIAGKYRLLAVQASGAFGTVFRAEQYFCQQRMRPVAVKVSRQTGITEESASYLFGDALMLARLLAGDVPANLGDEGRRHLVQIYDMGLLPEYDNRAYLVMEYIDGAPLIAHMRAAGRVSVAIGLRFVKQICRGIALVHAQGAVHRDLRGDNILVDRRGTVRVVDFGLAAFADPGLGFAPGAMGTFVYMAPETLDGRSTAASDIYSLGLLMYELFTGGGPHLSAPWRTEGSEDHRDEHFRIKQSLRFPPPSEVQNEIRNDFRWLDTVINRCLAVGPEHRYPDAGALLAAIESCQAGEAPEAIPTAPAAPKAPAEDAADALFREVRRLLAGRAYAQVIDRLDVHRPPEWAVLDRTGARTLRALGQAYLGQGDLAAARDCLEQLRTAQHEQALLPRSDFAAALSDLVKCYRGLEQPELAQARQEEARRLL